MSIMLHPNSTHQTTCNLAESARQTAVAAAGGNQVLVTLAEIAYYRSVIASCVANGIPGVSHFQQALRDLGTNGV